MRGFNLIVSIIFCFALAGCWPIKPDQNPDKKSASTPIPDVRDIAATLPQFAKKENEVQIAAGFNDVDPSWVIGALVDTKSGKVRSLDSYLKKSANLRTIPQGEVAFKNFIENSAAVNAEWLSFVQGKVSDTVRAEVTVTKISKVTADSSSIDKNKLLAELRGIPASDRAGYGVIIGYVDFVLSAAYFRNSGADASVSGYGAKIGGNWYSKYEDSAAHHRIVAIWAPLPFVLEVVQSPVTKDLAKATAEAIDSGRLNVRRLNYNLIIQ